MTIHIPVLMTEAIEGLELESGNVVVDATLGGGGYTRKLSDIVGSQGRVIALDLDQKAIEEFGQNSSSKNVTAVHANFAQITQVLADLNVGAVNAIVADLGISSDQLGDPARGLSFLADGPLDMRLDQSEQLTAEIIVNQWSVSDIAQVLRQYGDERYARPIARAIDVARTAAPITTTTQLAQIISAAVPGKYRAGRIHPATRTFQALRMVVNHERDDLQAFLDAAIGALMVGGHIAVVSFHSGEDAVVKRWMRAQARGCVCPASFPVCRCDGVSKLRIVTKKPVTVDAEELAKNPRARSAKLRIAQRIA